MNVSGRKVRSAKLHNGVFIQGIGDIGVTLVINEPGQKLAGLQMTLVDSNWMLVELKGREVLVPSTNIAHLELVKEDKKPA